MRQLFWSTVAGKATVMPARYCYATIVNTQCTAVSHISWQDMKMLFLCRIYRRLGAVIKLRINASLQKSITLKDSVMLYLLKHAKPSLIVSLHQIALTASQCTSTTLRPHLDVFACWSVPARQKNETISEMETVLFQYHTVQNHWQIKYNNRY